MALGGGVQQLLLQQQLLAVCKACALWFAACAPLLPLPPSCKVLSYRPSGFSVMVTCGHISAGIHVSATALGFASQNRMPRPKRRVESECASGVCSAVGPVPRCGGRRLYKHWRGRPRVQARAGKRPPPTAHRPMRISNQMSVHAGEGARCVCGAADVSAGGGWGTKK
jgi:hypothetical protein